MRGIPGSGKSTQAKNIAVGALTDGRKSVAILSTDDYHMEGDEYVFKPDRLGDFHRLNQGRAYKMMEAGIHLVIIDNTNIKRDDMRSYIKSAERLGYKVQEALVGTDDMTEEYIDKCAARNTHGVPRDVIAKMAGNFQK
jgi:predicted kinase